MTAYSDTWTWIDGEWLQGNPGIMGPRTHGAWLGSSVFDGARAFEGTTPDVDLHCERVNRSAVALGLQARMETDRIVELAQEGVAKFAPGTALYIRPMYWAEEGGPISVPPNPDTTKFCMCVYETAMPEPGTGFSVTLADIRRPMIDQAPVEAKAGCLYPMGGRALLQARARGFDNVLIRDAIGNIAELATANVFMAKEGVVHTPIWNGTFLNGITRQRVIKLLRDQGQEVVERAVKFEEFLDADEIFSTGNYSKVVPCNRIKDRDLQPGPVYAQARELYWEFAHGGRTG